MALRSPWLTIVCSLFGVCALCWFFPLLHVRPLGSVTQNEPASKQAPRIPRSLDGFDPFVARVQVTELWSAYDTDATAAQRQFGQQAGLGGAWCFCVQGSGIVESVDQNKALIKVEGNSRRVQLELGVIVDNTVREAFGVKASQFDNAQEYNALSTDLNRQVEELVIKVHRGSLVEGAKVSFVGCARVSGKADIDPLRLIPIQLNVRSGPLEAGTEQLQNVGAVAP